MASLLRHAQQVLRLSLLANLLLELLQALVFLQLRLLTLPHLLLLYGRSRLR